MQITCLAIHQPWASMIMAGEKSLEIRPWSTDHRGPLFIVAPTIDSRTREFFSPDLPHGVILGCVDLIDCRPMADPADTCCDDCDGFYRFVLRHPKTLTHPIPIKAGLHLFTADIDDARLHFGPTQPHTRHTNSSKKQKSPPPT